MKITDFARYQHALAQTGRTPGLAPARRAALDCFLEHGLPTTRDENWKYTSLDYLDKAEWHIPATPAQAHTAEIRCPDEQYPGAVMRFANGRLSASPALPWIALAHSLAACADTAPAAQVLGQLVAKCSGNNALAEINSALWRDGLFLHVPGGSRVLEPLFVAHRANEADAMLHVRNLIVLEAGTEAVLVEHFSGAPDIPYWTNSVSEIVLGAGARLTHLKLTEESAAATHTSLALVQQAQDSVYHAVSVSLGGRLARHEVRVDLNQAGAQCRLDGLFIADGRRHIDNHFQIEHAAPHTTSRQTWRGMAAGRGRGIFDARVVVQAGAAHADALQSSRNLLLSPHAEIDAKPQLEIYADDVKCGHGATVGQLDEAQVFYLCSRGIGLDAARALLLRGFAEEALGLLADSPLRGWLEPMLTAALPVWTSVHQEREHAT